MRNLAISLLALAASVGGCNAGSAAGGGASGTPAPAAGGVSVPPQLSVTMGRQFELRTGQSASVAGVSSVVTFRGVRNDSRCPADVQCVQAGNAEVVLGIATRGGDSEEVVLNTTTPPRERTLGNGILRLVSLSPARSSSSMIDSASYVATLCVCRQ